MPAPWFRSEQGEPLTAEQFDENTQFFIDSDAAIESGAAIPPYPSSIVQTGLTLTFYLSNAAVLGTATIPVPEINDRGLWLPLTNYFVNDLVRVRGIGFYLVLADHTSAASFTANSDYSFQYADQQVQLPLIVSTTALTLTRALHLNRLLLFTNISGCSVTLDPDDWLDGDQVHGMSRTSASVTVIGVTDLPVDPTDGFDAAVSTHGGRFSLVYLEDEDVMAMFGHLDAVSV